MLHRVLETEVMDTADEARDYNNMDHSKVNQVFVADLLQYSRSNQLELGDVLDMGTGTAQLPIELCEQESDCRIMAIDLSINMLELARYNIEVAGVIDRVTLAKADAKEMAYDDELFDTVISNSIIHHIPEPRDCIAEMVRVTSNGGMLFIRDLLRPESDQQVKSLVATYAGDETQHAQQMFDDSLRAALSINEIQQLVGEFGFAPQTVQQTTDRHWTWSAIKTEA